jgi:hypothetical protein
VETAEQPLYQRIAAEALHLRELGLIDRVMAKRLGVTEVDLQDVISSHRDARVLDRDLTGETASAKRSTS